MSDKNNRIEHVYAHSLAIWAGGFLFSFILFLWNIKLESALLISYEYTRK